MKALIASRGTLKSLSVVGFPYNASKDPCQQILPARTLNGVNAQEGIECDAKPLQPRKLPNPSQLVMEPLHCPNPEAYLTNAVMWCVYSGLLNYLCFPLF